MDNANIWITIFVVLVIAGVAYAIAQYITPDHSGDHRVKAETIANISNPNRGVPSSDLETARSEARRRLNEALARELISVEMVVRSQDSVNLVMQKLEMEFRELMARHMTILLTEQNTQAALKSTMAQGLRLAFFEQMMLLIATGDLGKTLTEVKRKELMDELEIKRMKAEDEIEFNGMLTFAQYKEDKEQREKQVKQLGNGS